MIPYGKQWIDEDDINEVVRVLTSDYLTQGPEIIEFEKNICDYTGAKYCVAVSNGTSALQLAVASLSIEKGKEGITSANTFVASANCLIYNRLTPIFADIDNKTYNIDIKDIKEKINERTKVIIPVDFAGHPADMKDIYELAKMNKLYIIEDASHAIGSKYEDGSFVGSCKYSDMTTFSFHPVKTITTGEGGAITTNNEELYEKLKLLRTHGITREDKYMDINPGPWYYEMHELGFNFRLTELQAALGINQLRKMNFFVKRRREIVRKYNRSFKEVDMLTAPVEKDGIYSAFHLYVVLIDFKKIGKSRKQIMEELRDRHIGTQVHYIPVHIQPYYQKNFGYKLGDYPVAERYYEKALSIPLYPKMTDDDVDYVINKILEVL
ncbi:MAG: UDP-4-amino-4,6-dideoxy-N-acetyl-beta-L-altrosamine transaminase [Candidatus Eremiobacterota bacterium]